MIQILSVETHRKYLQFTLTPSEKIICFVLDLELEGVEVVVVIRRISDESCRKSRIDDCCESGVKEEVDMRIIEIITILMLQAQSLLEILLINIV